MKDNYISEKQPRFVRLRKLPFRRGMTRSVHNALCLLRSSLLLCSPVLPLSFTAAAIKSRSLAFCNSDVACTKPRHSRCQVTSPVKRAAKMASAAFANKESTSNNPVDEGATELPGAERSRSFVGSIDQGTTSSRFLIFDTKGVPVASHQLEFTQSYPQSGWVLCPSPLTKC